VNGQRVGQGSHPGLAVRGGTLGLGFGRAGAGVDGVVEIEFNDFKAFAL